MLFESNTAVLDVLIVPPNHGQLLNYNGLLRGGGLGELTPSNSYLAAIEQSVRDFSRAVDQFGPDWLKRGLVTNVYVLGRDTPPTDALLEPEIVILTDETKLDVLGVDVTGAEPCIVANSKLAVPASRSRTCATSTGRSTGTVSGWTTWRAAHQVTTPSSTTRSTPSTPTRRAAPEPTGTA